MHHQDILTAAHHLITSFTHLLSPLTDEQLAARNKGLERYNLGEFLDAESDLTIAAMAGDSDAQYALGEVTQRSAGTINDAAKAWYRLAGEQSHVYALMRLGDINSLAKARKLAQNLVDVDDADAMLQMYELTKDTYWLSRAGAAGNGEALYLQAILSERTPELRNSPNGNTKLDTLLIRSANLGFPPAMQWLERRPYFALNAGFQTAMLSKRLEKNQLSAVMAYAYALLQVFVDKSDKNRYNVRRDKIKGYGLLWLVVNSTRQYIRHSEAAQTLETITATLNAEQIEAGKKFANDWKKQHPPLSAYNLTYSELK